MNDFACALKTAAEFEQSMRQVRRVLAASAGEFALFRASIDLLQGRARFVLWGGRRRDIQVGSWLDRQLQERRGC